MTRAEARRQAGEARDEAAYGPDPTEDPALYLEDEGRPGTEEKDKWTSGS